MSIPKAVLVETLRDGALLASYWKSEIPLRIHSRDMGEGGTPEWNVEFARWLGKADQFNDRKWRDNPEPRVRATRAFRKLREFSPREYEVCYRTFILDIPFATTVAWLNERAIRNQKEDRYTEEDALMLLICGIDKVANWFSWA